MKTFLKYLFVAVSLYLMLMFAADNPEKISQLKEFIDDSIMKIAEGIKDGASYEYI